MPLGVYVDEIFEFVEALFTPDDNYIVASRHTYLGIWNTSTGDPVRVLQSNISPITATFTCRYDNRVVTTLQDGTMQVGLILYCEHNKKNSCCCGKKKLTLSITETPLLNFQF